MRRWQRAVWWRNVLVVLGLGGIGTELLAFALLGAHLLPARYVLPIAGSLTVCWFGSCLTLAILTALQSARLRETLQTNDIAGLGSWIDVLDKRWAWAWQPRKQTQAYAELVTPVRGRLIAFLGDLQEEEAECLGAGQRRVLYNLLAGDDAELALAVLCALPVFADTAVLPAVQRLANGGAAQNQEEVQKAAQECLPLLYARFATRSNPRTLLRASAPTIPPDTLLRSTTSPSSTAPEQMLRAGHAQKESDE